MNTAELNGSRGGLVIGFGFASLEPEEGVITDAQGPRK